MIRPDARVKLLLLFFALAVCVTTPPDHFMALTSYLVLAACTAAVCRIPWRSAVNKLLILAPLLVAFALFIPFAHPEWHGVSNTVPHPRSGWMIFWNVASKGCFGVLAVTILTETTSFPAVLRALEQLHCPRLLVMLAGFVYRYAWVLADEVRRMQRACACRMHRGRWLWQAGLVGRLIGMLFLRSYERGERVYLAMMSRGFDGQIHSAPSASLRGADYAFGAMAACVFLVVRIAA